MAFPKIRKKALRFLGSVENSRLKLRWFIVYFLLVILLRWFLEYLIDPVKPSRPEIFFIHFSLFYMATALFLMLFVSFFTHEPIIKVSKIVLVSGALILLAPILDFAIGKGTGYDIGHMHPKFYDDPFGNYFTFFSEFNQKGITPGLRIELAIILIFTFLYLLVKTESTIKSLILALAIYTIGYIFVIFPFLVLYFNAATGIGLRYSDSLMSLFYFSSLIVMLILLKIKISSE